LALHPFTSGIIDRAAQGHRAWRETTKIDERINNVTLKRGLDKMQRAT